MPLPTGNDVALVSPVLTNLSIGFRNPNFFWSKLAPPLGVDLNVGTFPIFTRDYWFRRATTAQRASSGGYQRLGYGIASSTYSTREYGFEKVLSDPTRKSSQTPQDLQVVDTEFLTQMFELELEKQVAAAAFVTSVWGTSNTLTGTDQWSDFDGSDPINDAEVAKRTVRRNTGAKVNMLFIGALGWEKLKEHPLIIDKYKHTQVGVMTEALVAAVLGIDEIVVGESIENTAIEKAPGTASFTGADIWTDNAVWLAQETPGIDKPVGAITFMWDEIGNVPWAIQSYRDETVRSEVTRILSHWDIKIVSSQHGYMHLDLVA